MGAGVKRVGLGVVAVLVCIVVAGVPAASARAERPWWRLSSGSRPTELAPEGKGEFVATAENVGDANIDGAGAAGPAVIVDTLPPGLRATGVVGAEPSGGTRTAIPCTLLTSSRVTCELTGALAPYATVEVRVAVLVEGTKSGAANEVSVSGGGAPDAQVTHPLAIGVQPAAFGLEGYEITDEEPGGASDVQAGSHPFQQTTTIALNQTADLASLNQAPVVQPVALPKDLSFQWPAGMIGNATPIPRCTPAQFYTTVEGRENTCPAQSAVGVILLTVYEPATVGFATYTLPIFNVEPALGEPARFGFYAVEANAPGFIDTSLRAGGDYGVTVSIDNITQTAAFLSSRVTLWGTPGDPRHDAQRGWGCLFEALGEEHSPCVLTAERRQPALLTLPTSCSQNPLTGEAESLPSSVSGDAWEQTEPHTLVPLAEARMPGLSGCGAVAFSPEIAVAPDVRAAGEPTGLTVDLHVPQQSEGGGAGGEGGGEGHEGGGEALASSSVRDIELALPEGLALNPAAAGDLRACTESQVGFTGVDPRTGTDQFTPTLPEPLRPGVNFCPDESKLGSVEIRTPLLANPVEGALYLAAPNENPFGSLLALYLVASDLASGTLVKLAGDVTLDPRTGQVTVSFQNTPQLPLEDIELHFFEGERALLATPARCGAYAAAASLTPWSGNPAATPTSTFAITSGPDAGAAGGAGCPSAPLPFAPSLTAGTTSVQAGAFSPFTATISREGGQQAFQGFALRLPAGLSGMLASVPLCGEAQANAGACSAASQIGETTVSAGLGADPYTLEGGRVYLTGPYEGAPFGLAIATPVKAGPLDLENAPENHPACDCLVIRAKIEVDPRTAQLTIATAADAGTASVDAAGVDGGVVGGAGGIPSIIDGVPLQLRHLNITIDRAGFMFNPSGCNPRSIAGTIAGGESATAAVSSPFQVANCAALAFKPRLELSTSGKTSRRGGAGLHVKLVYPKASSGRSEIGQQANLASVKVDLPKRLVSRLGTLQGACVVGVFEQNPAACPATSKVGTASVTTPVLPATPPGRAPNLTGPAIFVSHGGKRFPELILVLQGDGVRIDLHAETFISRAGVTSSTFRTIPDVPIGTFELNLPEGSGSALAANGNLCQAAGTVTSSRRDERVEVRVHGHLRTVTRRVKRHVGGLVMPTALTAHNGAVIHQNTPIRVTGCPNP